MKRFVLVFGMLITAAGASAQPAATTLSADPEGIELKPSAEASREDSPDKSRVYDKRVGGLFWLEATAGPSRFDATRFRNLDIVPAEVQSAIPRVVVSGPEVGAALMFRAGSSTVGARFRRANYEPFDLTSIGLDLGFMIRAIPYVHPTIRLAFSYYTTTGGLVIPGYQDMVSNVRSQGGGATMGLGLRIPVIKWISLAAEFDYSIIGLVFRGNETFTGGSFTAGTAGTAIAGTFALTFHVGS